MGMAVKHDMPLAKRAKSKNKLEKACQRIKIEKTGNLYTNCEDHLGSGNC